MEMGLLAIAIMYIWAGFFAALTILFAIQYRRFMKKLGTMEVSDTYIRKVWSFDWEEKKSRRKIIAARGIYMWIIISSAWAAGGVGIYILGTMGHALFVLFLGFPVFLDSEAFLALQYSVDIIKESPALQSQDKEYITEVLSILKTRSMLYAILSAVFFLVAPYISLVFGLIPPIIASLLGRPIFYLIEKFGIIVGFPLSILFYASVLTLTLWTISQISRLILKK